MRLQLMPSPFLEPIRDDILTERETILHRIEQCGDLEWAQECVAVYMNGIFIPKAWWPYVTMKPEAEGLTVFVIVAQKGSLVPIIASVALIALTAGIGTFGVPFLGAGFAAGTFGASAVAAGVGIAGQIALRALTAPPSVKNAGGDVKDLSQAGIDVNIVAKLQLLPTLHGKVRVSPMVISPTYTTWDGNEVTVHAIVGIQGPNEQELILLNGTDIALIEGLTYETRNGDPGDAPLTLAQLTCIQQTEQVTLSNFLTKLELTKNDSLIDQVTPANSSPDYHYFKTDGIADEIWLRLQFPSGIVYTPSVIPAAVALRIEIRKVGDVTWRKLPTAHIYDVNKGSGPLRVEIKLKFQTQPSGRHFSNASDEYPIFELTNTTGIGQTFEYVADAYFQNAAVPGNINTGSEIPVMTAATTTGVTMSASSEFAAGNAAWKASDNSGATSWRPTANSLPAWIKVDFGSAKTIRCWYVEDLGAPLSVPTTTMPVEFFLEGSTDNVNWTILDSVNVDISAFVLPRIWSQVGTPGSYRYYRLNVVTNNGAASEDMNIGQLRMFTFDCPGSALGVDYSANYGDLTRHNSINTSSRSVYGNLDKSGATFYLDPAQWLPGEYEVRVKRSIAFAESDFTTVAYSYGGVTNTDFFDYRLSAGVYLIRVGQKNYRSDALMEVFSTVSNDVPVDTSGITCIAVELKNTVIRSISSLMTSKAPLYMGSGVWSDAWAATQNPAALYRRLKLGHAHPNPTDGEILDEDELADWYLRCVALGHECNFLQQGRSIGEVMDTIAFTGYASPKEANISSVVQDYDRSVTGTNEPISQLLSPLNCRLIGANVGLPDVEHAIIAEYLNDADDFNVARETVYRDGFDANTAKFFVTITYEGITNTAKVIARANFDIKQSIYRSYQVKVEVDIEGFDLWRGKLVGHSDDVLHNKVATAQIVSIQDNGVNVTGITVDNIVPFAANQDDLDALMAGLDLSNATGVAIRLPDDTVIVKTLTNVVDSKVAIFSTPFAIGSTTIAVGQLLAFGIATRNPYERMLVMAVDMQGFEKRILTLAPEAPELFQ